VTILAALTDTRKALEEQRQSERAAALALEKEEVARTVERQLLAAQKAAAPEADDTISSPSDNTSSGMLHGCLAPC
jgi:hypothetical protein